VIEFLLKQTDNLQGKVKGKQEKEKGLVLLYHQRQGSFM